MLNRRILRVKVLQVLYAYKAKETQSIESAFKELQKGANKTHDLFFSLLLLAEEIRLEAERIIDIRKNKITASAQERHPNLRFVDNRVLKEIIQHDSFETQVKSKKLNWNKHKSVIKKLTLEILESADYENYLNALKDSFSNDKKFLIHIFETILFNTEDLYANLEEQNIYWTSDVDFVIKKIAVLISNISEDKPETVIFPPVYKKDDDRTFARDLLFKAIKNQVKYRDIIEKHIVNWDIDRVTKTDRLIMQIAVAETIGFDSIPIKVTINEYIELSKMYSSPKNAKFVNGVLDKVINELKENEVFKKTGRGLVE
ncbi:MAG: transcription antitermination factor NusB [Bacteroidota bacterium]|nr:transcription antitermination factor NusB [Bacteroidota bacterium]